MKFDAKQNFRRGKRGDIFHKTISVDSLDFSLRRTNSLSSQILRISRWPSLLAAHSLASKPDQNGPGLEGRKEGRRNGYKTPVFNTVVTASILSLTVANLFYEVV